MRLILALVFITLAAASTLHYSPAAREIYLLMKSPSPPAKKQYLEQDSKGFYSFGYSGDTAAKAEYTLIDGSSKGFFSYIDADGELQTVKYEAGKKKGFTAAATNLPKAPMDKSKPPSPVKDTPEVQAAKLAHFEAYREAELRAAWNRQKDQNSVETGAQAAQEADGEEQQDEQQDEQQKENVEADKDDKAADNEREEDTKSNGDMMTNGNEESSNENTFEDFQEEPGKNQDCAEQEATGNDEPQEMNDFMLKATNNNINNNNNNNNNKNNNNDNNDNTYYADLPDLHTIYTLEDDKSSTFLKLSGLTAQQRQSYLQPQAAELQSTTTIEAVRVPVHSYYTVLAPSTKYSVTTPTELVTVPGEQAARLGNRLPISLSTTFSSQRLRSS